MTYINLLPPDVLAELSNYFPETTPDAIYAHLIDRSIYTSIKSLIYYSGCWDGDWNMSMLKKYTNVERFILRVKDNKIFERFDPHEINSIFPKIKIFRVEFIKPGSSKNNFFKIYYIPKYIVQIISIDMKANGNLLDSVPGFNKNSTFIEYSKDGIKVKVNKNQEEDIERILCNFKVPIKIYTNTRISQYSRVNYVINSVNLIRNAEQYQLKQISIGADTYQEAQNFFRSLYGVNINNIGKYTPMYMKWHNKYIILLFDDISCIDMIYKQENNKPLDFLYFKYIEPSEINKIKLPPDCTLKRFELTYWNI